MSFAAIPRTCWWRGENGARHTSSQHPISWRTFSLDVRNTFFSLPKLNIKSAKVLIFFALVHTLPSHLCILHRRAHAQNHRQRSKQPFLFRPGNWKLRFEYQIIKVGRPSPWPPPDDPGAVWDQDGASPDPQGPRPLLSQGWKRYFEW